MFKPVDLFISDYEEHFLTTFPPVEVTNLFSNIFKWHFTCIILMGTVYTLKMYLLLILCFLCSIIYYNAIYIAATLVKDKLFL